MTSPAKPDTQGRKHHWDLCTCGKWTQHVHKKGAGHFCVMALEAIPAWNAHDALLAERDALAKLIDVGCDCPKHGKWMDHDSGYSICGRCHDEVKSKRDALKRALERATRILEDLVSRSRNVKCKFCDSFDRVRRDAIVFLAATPRSDERGRE